MYISENDKVMVRQLVERQLQAFQQNDLAAAFALMSPAVREKFNLSEFIAKVESHYNAIIKPRAIMFRGFTTIDSYPALVATIMDEAGELVQGVFVVQHQGDYSWRIQGYELVPLDEKIV